MKASQYASAKVIITPLLFLFLLLHPSCLVFAQDCLKNSDACSAGTKKTLPFLRAAAAAEAKAAAREKAGKELKPGAARPSPAPDKSGAPAAEVVSGTPVPEPGKETISSPAWLLFVGAALAGLYFYLRANTKRGKKK